MCQHGRRGASRAVVRGAVTAEVDWDYVDELAERGMTSDGRPFESLYGGLCHGCGGRWEPGDPIAWSADEGSMMHADCVHGQG